MRENKFNHFLESAELGVDIILRYFLAILIAVGILAMVYSSVFGTGASTTSTIQRSELSISLFWAVLALGLIIVWREIRELRRRMEHLAWVKARPVYAKAREKLKK